MNTRKNFAPMKLRSLTWCSKLRSLTEISMTNCKLNVLSDQSFSSLGKLRSINLSNNNITSFSPKVINDTVGQKQITVGTIHKLSNRDKGRGKVVKMVVPPSLPPSTRFSSFDFTTFQLFKAFSQPNLTNCKERAKRRKLRNL